MSQPSSDEIEIGRLQTLVKRREAQLQHAYDWRYEKELELEALKRENALLIQANRAQAVQIAVMTETLQQEALPCVHH